MKTRSSQSSFEETSRKKKKPETVRSLTETVRSDSAGGRPFVFRKAACACGGDCPTCESNNTNLPISHPADASEIEADAVADRIMRMPEPSALQHPPVHVAEQNTGAARFIQRTVGPHSSCAANVHDAPADPLAVLADADQFARDKALSASVLLLLESFEFDDPTVGRTRTFDAYRHWFGTPTATSSGQWRSRFRTAPFATENEAIRHELETFSERFQRIKDWLDGDITYRCPGTGTFTIPGCRTSTCGGSAAVTCGPSGSRRIVICPNYWTPVNRAFYAEYLIHEAAHPLFHFLHHPTSTTAGRARNPGCYEGFVGEIHSTGAPPADCTALP